MSLQQYDSYEDSGSMTMMAFGLVWLADLFVWYKVMDATTSNDWKMVKNLALYCGSAKLVLKVVDMVIGVPMMPIAGFYLVQEVANPYLINKSEEN